MAFTSKLRRSAAAGAAVVLATAGMLVTAGSGAGATPEGTTVLAPAKCADYGWVTVTAQALSMFSGPGLHYPTVGPTLYRGHRLSCYAVEAHDPRYDLCGYSNVNGWIPIDRDGNGWSDAYVPSVCVADE
ncbi:hypothetical protein KIPE111705_40530 [Kibdelosporangium persicum]|uniref:Secreted protein n=1 Tax=Kibdelosporangium persicum TaxID=2698649 RepID=A0ABX2F187_9PSEU|nr:hypothetical protein [Kibdelosporangium persicum]NRN64620.1 hypothetical protein [Kibdelosporangium persicum]